MRFNCTIFNMLSTVVLDDEHNWDLHLPTLMMAYCTSHHETTGATLFSFVYGQEAKLPEDNLFNVPSVEVTNSHGYAEALKECIQHAHQRVRDHSAVEQIKQKVNYDRFTQENTFQSGRLVWLHCPAVPRGKSPKFHHPWQGQFKVVKKIGSVVYHIQHGCDFFCHCIVLAVSMHITITVAFLPKTRGNELLCTPTDSKDTTVRERMNTLKRTGSFCRVRKSKSMKLFLM